jgi:hypothetical protein
LQILNRDDNCCFGERQHHVAGISYTGAVRDYERDVPHVLAKMHTGRFVVHVNQSAHYH